MTPWKSRSPERHHHFRAARAANVAKIDHVFRRSRKAMGAKQSEREAETDVSANRINSKIGFFDFGVRDVAIGGLEDDRPAIVQHEARPCSGLQVELDWQTDQPARFILWNICVTPPAAI